MQKLTERSVHSIMMMFEEPALRNKLLDDEEKNAYSKISIDTDRCEIVLGKTRYGWWNSFIGAEKRISLAEFTFTTIGILANKAEKDGNESMISEGLLKDTADALQREGRSNDIIDRLFLVGYLGVKTAWSCLSLNAEGSVLDNNKPQKMNLRINDETMTFNLPGSNDPIFRVTIGPKGVQYIGD
uniref:Uncharacterized protein n=1 Tax=Dulem virus 42 TaxID=3145760 RepID=A0AAU8BA69_9CAUD